MLKALICTYGFNQNHILRSHSEALSLSLSDVHSTDVIPRLADFLSYLPTEAHPRQEGSRESSPLREGIAKTRGRRTEVDSWKGRGDEEGGAHSCLYALYC